MGPPESSLARFLYDLVAGVLNVSFPLVNVAAAASLVVRFRRSRGVERQQLRWVALVAALVPVAVLVAVGAALVGGPAADSGDLLRRRHDHLAGAAGHRGGHPALPAL
jgi:hypothetical protein